MSEPVKPTTALALVPTAFEPSNINQAIDLADRMSKSNLLPTALRGKSNDVLIVLMAGHEMGLSPMQAIRGMHVIEGRPTMSAELMVAQCLRHPTICEAFEMLESTPEKATYEAKRKGARPQKLTFTIKEAQSAGITNKDNWRKWPAAMLRARASGALARVVFPDLVGGIYDEDEAEDIPRPEPLPVRDITPPRAPESVTTSTAAVSDAEFMVAPDIAGLEALRAKLGAAATVEECQALIPMINALRIEQKEQIRHEYGVRVKALKAPATKPPPPVEEPPMPEPGSEG